MNTPAQPVRRIWPLQIERVDTVSPVRDMCTTAAEVSLPSTEKLFVFRSLLPAPFVGTF
jgi:hypothetical protein